MNIFQEGFILKRKQKNKVFILIPAGVVLAGVIGGLIFWGTHHSGDDSVCQETVAKLETLQNADISATEQQIQELPPQMVPKIPLAAPFSAMWKSARYFPEV